MHSIVYFVLCEGLFHVILLGGCHFDYFLQKYVHKCVCPVKTHSINGNNLIIFLYIYIYIFLIEWKITVPINLNFSAFQLSFS